MCRFIYSLKRNNSHPAATYQKAALLQEIPAIIKKQLIYNKLHDNIISKHIFTSHAEDIPRSVYICYHSLDSRKFMLLHSDQNKGRSFADSDEGHNAPA